MRSKPCAFKPRSKKFKHIILWVRENILLTEVEICEIHGEPREEASDGGQTNEPTGKQTLAPSKVTNS